MQNSTYFSKKKLILILIFLTAGIILIGEIYDIAYNFKAFPIQAKIFLSILLLAGLILSLLQRFRISAHPFSLPAILGILLLTSLISTIFYYYENYVYYKWDTLKREEMKGLAAEMGQQFNSLINFVERETRSLGSDNELLNLLAQNEYSSRQREIFNILRQELEDHKLPEQGFGLCLLSPEGDSIAWFGEAKPFIGIELELQDISDESIFIYKGFVSTWLNVLIPLKRGEDKILGYALGQLLLESHYGLKDGFFQGKNRPFSFAMIDEDRVSIDFYDFREESTELKALFRRHGLYFWSHSRGEEESLFYPLYSFNKDILGVGTIVGLTRESYVSILGSLLQFIAALLLILLIAVLAGLQLKSYLKLIKKESDQSVAKWAARSFSALVALIFLLWITRWLLIKLNLPLNLKSFLIFDPRYFAARSPFHLMKSPADFLLTALFFFISLLMASLLAWEIARRIKRIKHKSKRRLESSSFRAIKLFSSFLLALLIAAILSQFNMFLGHIAFNSGTKLIIFSLEPPHLPRLCIEIGLHFFAISCMTAIFLSFFIFANINSKDEKLNTPLSRLIFFVLTIIVLMLILHKAGTLFIIGTALLLFISAFLLFNFGKIRKWLNRSSSLARITFLYLISFLAIMLYYPAIFDALDKLKLNFVEKEIVPQIRNQKEWGSFLLNQSFSIIDQSKRLKDELKSSPSESRGIAYSFWREMGFGSSEFNSSLVVINSQGDFLDIFSFYLPHVEPDKLEDLQQYIEPVIESKWLHYGSREIEVIQGIKTVVDNSEIIGAVVASVSIGHDNLAFIHSKDPYYEIFQPKGHSSPEKILFNEELFLLAYEWDGRIRFSSAGKIFPLESKILEKLRNSELPILKRFSFEGENYRLVYFSSLGYPLAIGFPQNSFKDYLFSFAGLLAINALALLFLSFLYFLFKISRGSFRFSWFNLWDGIIKSFYRKLLSLLILISIIPMIFLSLSIKEYLSDRLVRQIKEEGIATAQFAKRVMEDYLFVQEKELDKPEELIDDNLALLISSWVNQDIHIFFSDSLKATNKKELFSAGLISPRINDEIYYQLTLAKHPYFASQHKMGNFNYLVISVPIELPKLQKPTILSTPLMLEQRQLEIEIAEINDAIFIATVILIIFCAILSSSIARRVSGPIKRLTHSTYQISEGNFDLKVATDSKDEMKELVESFNRMAQNLKQQQMTLRERKEYIEKILLNATTGVLSLNNKNDITTINPAAITLLYLKQKQLIGQPLLHLIARSNGLKEFRNSLKEFLRKPQRQLIREIQIRHFRQQINLRVKFIPLRERGSGISGSIILLEDITEVIKSNRLATWAEMARIIAHEIKNPLTPIQLSADHLLQVIKDQPPGYEDITDTCIKTIIQQVELLRQLSTEFSNYAKLPQLKLSTLNIKELINQIVESYSSLKRAKFQVNTEIAEDLPQIRGDKELLRRALTNIVENSLEAMPAGGELTIKVRSSFRKGHKGVSIEVIDTGIGIDNITMKRLFEPYFSTKESGVGLGLAITKKALEEHQGEIKVKSAKKKGTKVTIWLPAEKYV